MPIRSSRALRPAAPVRSRAHIGGRAENHALTGSSCLFTAKGLPAASARGCQEPIASLVVVSLRRHLPHTEVSDSSLSAISPRKACRAPSDTGIQ